MEGTSFYNAYTEKGNNKNKIKKIIFIVIIIRNV